MHSSSPTVLVKARALIFLEGKVFLCKLEWGFWCLPGGTLEPGETVEECLKRELFEELGVHAEIDQMVYTQNFVNERGTIVDLWYTVKNPEVFLQTDLVNASHGFELTDARFVDVAELRLSGEIVKPDHLEIILASLK